MPYMIHADERHELVEVVYTGSITISTRICAMEDGAILLQARGYTRVLVDLSAATAVPEAPDAVNAFAARMVLRPRVANSRLAYVVRPGPQPGLLAATVPPPPAPTAGNRDAAALVNGIAATHHAELRHFHARTEALHWLLTGT
jgi:hypothetical protein